MQLFNRTALILARSLISYVKRSFLQGQNCPDAFQEKDVFVQALSILLYGCHDIALIRNTNFYR
ncbi:MAG: hypothetical protein B6D34_12010 [Candidatus Brocadia sp. UTAMX1]|nr:MAG: hypothetical protein B6D34_12010 [Candidatus Brocadia sp. UTAMX1]